jgi:hypothetical protein
MHGRPGADAGPIGSQGGRCMRGGRSQPPRHQSVQGGVEHDQARAVGKGPWLSPLSFLFWVAVSRDAICLFCLLLVQFHAE